MTKAGFVAGLVVYLIASTTFFTVMSLRHDAKTDHAINSNRTLARQGAQAHVTLCGFRDSLAKDIEDQQAQLDRSRAFFKSHPTALADIPRAVIQQGFDETVGQITRAKNRLDAIDLTLRCP